MGFSIRLAQLMQAKKITSYRLAKSIDVHPSTVKNWLDGKEPRAEYLNKVAGYFAVSSDYLLGKTDLKNPSPVSAPQEEEMTELLDEFKDNPQLRTLFSLTSKANPEELRQYIDVIKALRGNKDEAGDH